MTETELARIRTLAAPPLPDKQTSTRVIPGRPPKRVNQARRDRIFRAGSS
jgi:hypothetical protein